MMFSTLILYIVIIVCFYFYVHRCVKSKLRAIVTNPMYKCGAIHEVNEDENKYNTIRCLPIINQQQTTFQSLEIMLNQIQLM